MGKAIRFLSDWWPLIIPAVLVWAILSLVLGAIISRAPDAVPKFVNSQAVIVKLTGARGMVVGWRCRPQVCFYDVRVSGLEIATNTTMWRKDGPVSVAPIALLSGLREYELEAAP